MSTFSRLSMDPDRLHSCPSGTAIPVEEVSFLYCGGSGWWLSSFPHLLCMPEAGRGGGCITTAAVGVTVAYLQRHRDSYLYLST